MAAVDDIDATTAFFEPKTVHYERRSHATVQAISFDKEAWALLRHYCPPLKRNIGKFLCRLIYEHHARMEERQRLLEEQRQAANGVNHGED